MRAQKHSSSLVGCGDATKAEDHPDVREKVKTWWNGWAGAVVLVFLRLKKNGGFVTEIVLLGCFGMFVVRLIVYDPLTG